MRKLALKADEASAGTVIANDPSWKKPFAIHPLLGVGHFDLHVRSRREDQRTQLVRMDRIVIRGPTAEFFALPSYDFEHNERLR